MTDPSEMSEEEHLAWEAKAEEAGLTGPTEKRMSTEYEHAEIMARLLGAIGAACDAVIRAVGQRGPTRSGLDRLAVETVRDAWAKLYLPYHEYTRIKPSTDELMAAAVIAKAKEKVLSHAAAVLAAVPVTPANTDRTAELEALETLTCSMDELVRTGWHPAEELRDAQAKAL